MKRVALLACLLLPMTVIVDAAPVQARPADQVCTATFTSRLNLSAAAQVMVPNGKRKPRRAGSASAQSLAAIVLVDTKGNPCTEPLSESAKENIDNVQSYLDEGDTTGAHDYLMQLATEATWTPSSTRIGFRAGTTCQGFDSHGLKLPEQVRTEIGIAQRAQALGFDDVATSAMANAVSITQSWGDSGADGAATSIPDWMGIAAKLELIGADQSVIDKARTSMNKVAKDAYDQYNKHACRTTKNDITCFLKAAQFLAAIGAEPTTFQKDVAYQVTNARDLARGKDKLCPVEKYLLRIRFQTSGPEGQTSDFDTGLITLVVKDHKITSPDAKRLRIVGTGVGGCWAKDENDQWARVGEGVFHGGTFPMTVAGTDDGALLHVQLKQKAHVSLDVSGSNLCQLAQLGVDFTNKMLAGMASPGLDLPAGENSEELTQVEQSVFEPTNETVTSTTTTVFKQIYPKRDVPEDPYS
ncbi:MAG: hypothetical protein WCP95_11860 [Actinomycetes bacterium]